MNTENTSAGVEAICLEVYGMLSASITHEIKNTLSIINENAGLLQDLCSMVDGEEGIPAGRVESTMQTITSQVSRSSIIMKNLNRFAHSNDKVPGQTDLAEMLRLMVELTSRFAAMRKVSATVSGDPETTINTNLLVLHSLVFLTLYKLYGECPENSVLQVIGEVEEARQVTIRFMLEGESAVNCPPGFPGLKETTLAQEIGATCKSQDGQITIQLAASLQ